MSKKAEEGQEAETTRRERDQGGTGEAGRESWLRGPDMETWQCVYAETAADGDLGSGNLLGS